MPQQRVVVAGDVLIENCLIQGAATGPDAMPAASLERVPGGAWWLAKAVQAACTDLDVSIAAPALREESAGQAFRLWRFFDREALRIAQSLGWHAGTETPEAPDEAAPDVVALHDMNLGWRDQESAWPRAIASGLPRAVVLNTCAPLGAGKLWQLLASRFADRLTVILTAPALRERALPLATALSWDVAAEQIAEAFAGPPCSRDLGRARRIVVLFGLSGAAVCTRSDDGETARFERLFFDPEHLEGEWEARRGGVMHGAAAIVTAALVRHELRPSDYPLNIALRRGLAAARAHYEAGGAAFTAGGNASVVRDSLRIAPGAPEPARKFFAAPAPRMRDGEFRSDILGEVIGEGYEFVLAKAVDAIVRGPAAALQGAPQARFGKFYTVDRDEIERINAIRNLIVTYRASAQDRRPLSIAVFGPPGSGKSFAIKQLASEVLGAQPLVFESNLSQFDPARPEDLHSAFHRVRDGSVHGRIPLVFWDEFDTDGLHWLKHFLAPMQDSEFRSGGLSFPFGKAVFVFAGGTAHTFEAFDKSGSEGAEGERFRALKGPDFVSRLRGYVNIKGPNPTAGRNGDVAHLIRRGLLFRSVLERMHPHIVDRKTGLACVSPAIAEAFLRASRFLHGARSLETIVAMSSLNSARWYGPAELPSADLLRLHVSGDFLAHVRAAQIDSDALESLAEATHSAWAETKRRTGEAHPLLRPYNELPESDKERSRATARLTKAKLLSLGYRVVPAGNCPEAKPSAEEREQLVQMEHDIWLRNRLISGHEWAESTDERLFLHRGVAPLDSLLSADRELDSAIVDGTLGALGRLGYALVRCGDKPE